MAKRQTKVQDIPDFKSAWVALEGRREIIEFEVDAGNLIQSPRLEDELRQAIEKIREAKAAVQALRPELRSNDDLQSIASEFAEAAKIKELDQLKSLRASGGERHKRYMQSVKLDDAKAAHRRAQKNASQIARRAALKGQ